MFLQCKSKNGKALKQVDLKGFVIEIPSECSIKKYIVDEGYSGEINCSGNKFHYQFGSFTTEVPSFSDTINFNIEIDTIETYTVRTLSRPKSKTKGSLALKLDDINPKLDDGDYRLVRRLIISSRNFDSTEIDNILSIYKTARFK